MVIMGMGPGGYSRMRIFALGDRGKCVLSIIETHPGIRQFELRGATGYEAATLRHVLLRLASMDMIRAEPSDFTWRYYKIEKEAEMK